MNDFNPIACAEERRAAAVNAAKEVLKSGDVTTWWCVSSTPKIFQTFNTLVESIEFYELGFNDGEEVY